MEISLEKIEVVKDRTGVSYKEAKEALMKAEGNVLDAIIMLEDEIDITPQSKAEDGVSRIIETVKEVVKKGNTSKIVVKRDGNVILSIPVNLGLLGVIIIDSWVVLLAAVLTVGSKCTVEIVKNNGEVININEKASETLSDVKEKGSDAFYAMKDQASSVINKVRNDSNIKLPENEPDDEDEDIEIDLYVKEDETEDSDTEVSNIQDTDSEGSVKSVENIVDKTDADKDTVISDRPKSYKSFEDAIRAYNENEDAEGKDR